MNTPTDLERCEFLPCPFCGGGVMPRHALFPSDGNTDSIIHATPTDPWECGMVCFDIGSRDHGVSTAAAWNRRAELARRVEGPVELDDDAIVTLLRKAFPGNSKAYDSLTFERSPEFFPQAAYDVPTVGCCNFVKLVREYAASAPPMAGGEG